jgi:hypothetical protein
VLLEIMMESSLRSPFKRSMRNILVHNFHRQCDRVKMEQMTETLAFEGRGILDEPLVNPRQKQRIHIFNEIWL